MLLAQKIKLLVCRFHTAPVTPASTLDFETELRGLLDQCGRLVLLSAFNHVEPEGPRDAPKRVERDGLQ